MAHGSEIGLRHDDGMQAETRHKTTKNNRDRVDDTRRHSMARETEIFVIFI